MSVRPLSYDEVLTFEEANERLNEVFQEFDSIRKKYMKGPRKFQFWMNKKDKKRLVDCVGVLLPLSLRQFEEEKNISEDERIIYKSSLLTYTICDMMASYINTKTKRIGYRKPIWKDFKIESKPI
jgi:hypothetical protein